MAIRTFDLGPLRGLQRAQAADLGNLVVLAGPNGAGKSSLLELLRRNRYSLVEPGTTVMFVGPHRTWRSSVLNKVSLFGYPMASYGALLESDNLPSFQYAIPQGMQGLQGAVRDAGSADDAPAFVKTSLGRLRDRQQALVTTEWEQNGGQIQLGAVPDVFQPFRRLIGTLLPHLAFKGVDDSDPNSINVNFSPIEDERQVFDIDQLSSGEKSAIALLLPLVERQAEELLNPANGNAGVVPLTMLLDEPEIHLHPLLQLQVLQYLRELASERVAQFILSTHSPTLLDALDDDELYLVSPAAVSPDNQLSRLTSSQERLEVAREITGSTHLLTRSKPIVFVEGEAERGGVSSDARVMTNLLPLAKSWALVPGRSKSEVVSSVQRLRQEGVQLPGTPVFGLVDADSDSTTADPHVISWPVAMIENLLLDAEGIFEALSPFGSQTLATSAQVVKRVLDEAARSRVEDEVRLRVQRQLPVGRLAVGPSDVQNAQAVGQAELEKWLARIEKVDFGGATAAARSEVEKIVDEGRELERFHGKKILRAVYDALDVSKSGVGHSAFMFLLSTSASVRLRADTLATASLERIRLFFPFALVDKLTQLQEVRSDVASLLAECETEYQGWLVGSAAVTSRAALRERVFAFARTLDESDRSELVGIASRIGTP